MNASRLSSRSSQSFCVSSAAVGLWALISCGSPSNGALFQKSGTQNVAGASASAGAGPSSGAAGIAGADNVSVAGGVSMGGSASASAGGNAGSGGTASGGSSGAEVDPAQGSGTAGNAGGAAVPLDCSTLNKDATYYSETRHCYLVVNDESTYREAQANCDSMGAHLVTIGSEAENAFAWSLDSNEHWIGTSDGKGAKENTPGTYTWVTGEAFTYRDWSHNQPDAGRTNCGDENGGGDCFEHCGFQWTGGERPGQWNDRYCLHTIRAICEWDH